MRAFIGSISARTFFSSRFLKQEDNQEIDFEPLLEAIRILAEGDDAQRKINQQNVKNEFFSLPYTVDNQDILDAISSIESSLEPNSYVAIKDFLQESLNNRKVIKELIHALDGFVAGKNGFGLVQGKISALPDYINFDELEEFIFYRYNDLFSQNTPDGKTLREAFSLLINVKKNYVKYNKVSRNPDDTEAESINFKVAEKILSEIDERLEKVLPHAAGPESLRIVGSLERDKTKITSRYEEAVKEQSELLYLQVQKFINGEIDLKQLADFVLEQNNLNKIVSNDLGVCYEAVKHCIKKLEKDNGVPEGKKQEALKYLSLLNNEKANSLRNNILQQCISMIETHMNIVNDMNKKYQGLVEELALAENDAKRDLIRNQMNYAKKAIDALNFFHGNEKEIMIYLMEANIFSYDGDVDHKISEVFKLVLKGFIDNEALMNESALYVMTAYKTGDNSSSFLNFSTYLTQVYTRYFDLGVFAIIDYRMQLRQESVTSPEHLISLKDDSLQELYREIPVVINRLNSIATDCIVDIVMNARVLLSIGKINDPEILSALNYIESCDIDIKCFSDLDVQKHGLIINKCLIVSEFLRDRGYSDAADRVKKFGDMVGESLGVKNHPVSTRLGTLQEIIQDEIAVEKKVDDKNKENKNKKRESEMEDSDAQYKKIKQEERKRNDIFSVIGLAINTCTKVRDFNKLFKLIMSGIDLSKIEGLRSLINENGNFEIRDINKIIEVVKSALDSEFSGYNAHLKYVLRSIQSFDMALKMIDVKIDYLPLRERGHEVSHKDLVQVFGSELSSAVIKKIKSNMMEHGYDKLNSLKVRYDDIHNVYYIICDFSNHQGLKKCVRFKMSPSADTMASIDYDSSDAMNRLIPVRNAAFELCEELKLKSAGKYNAVEILYLTNNIEKLYEHYSRDISAEPVSPEKTNLVVQKFYRDLARVFVGKYDLKDVIPKIVQLESHFINQKSWDALGSVYMSGLNIHFDFAYPLTEAASSFRDSPKATVNSWEINSAIIVENKDAELITEYIFEKEKKSIRHGSPNNLEGAQDNYHEYIDQDIQREYLLEFTRRINVIDLHGTPEEIKALIENVVKDMVENYVIRRASEILLSPVDSMQSLRSGIDAKRILDVYNYQKSLDKVKIELNINVFNDVLQDRKSVLTDVLADVLGSPSKEVSIKHECIQFNFPLNNYINLPFGINRGEVYRKINIDGLSMVLGGLASYASNAEFKGLCNDLISKLSDKAKNYPFKDTTWLDDRAKLVDLFNRSSVDDKKIIQLLLGFIEHLAAAENTQRFGYAVGFISTSLGYSKEGEMSPIHHNLIAGAYASELCEQLGFKVDFFCKSGEDRTGLFHSVKQTFIPGLGSLLPTDPGYQAHMTSYFNKLPHAIFGCVSNDIAEQNAPGAGRLQIIPYIFQNFSEAREIIEETQSHAIAKTAKTPHEKAQKRIASSGSRRSYDIRIKDLDSFEDVIAEEINFVDKVELVKQLSILLEKIKTANVNGYSDSLNKLLKKLSSILNYSYMYPDNVRDTLILFKDFISFESLQDCTVEQANNLLIVIKNPRVINAVLKDTIISNDQELINNLKDIVSDIDYLTMKKSQKSADLLLVKMRHVLENYESKYPDSDYIKRIKLSSGIDEQSVYYTDQELIDICRLISKNFRAKDKLAITKLPTTPGSIPTHVVPPVAPTSSHISHVMPVTPVAPTSSPTSPVIPATPVAPTSSPTSPVMPVAPSAKKPGKSAVLPSLRSPARAPAMASHTSTSSFNFRTSIAIKDIESCAQQVFEDDHGCSIKKVSSNTLNIESDGNIAVWKKTKDVDKSLNLTITFDEESSIKDRESFAAKQMEVYWEAKAQKNEDHAKFETIDNNNYVTQILMLGSFCDRLLRGIHNIDINKVAIVFCDDSILKPLESDTSKTTIKKVVDAVIKNAKLNDDFNEREAKPFIIKALNDYVALKQGPLNKKGPGFGSGRGPAPTTIRAH